MGLAEKIKYAFSTGSEEEFNPTGEQKAVVEQITEEVVKRKMGTPALIFLETMRPLNYIGSQVMHFFNPFISAIMTTDKYNRFTEFLEHRKSVDYLCDRIEYYENEYGKKESLPDSRSGEISNSNKEESENKLDDK